MNAVRTQKASLGVPETFKNSCIEEIRRALVTLPDVPGAGSAEGWNCQPPALQPRRDPETESQPDLNQNPFFAVQELPYFACCFCPLPLR